MGAQRPQSPTLPPLAFGHLPLTGGVGPRTPVYGRAWYENPAQMYRRGVASDASPFFRPLPLCGKIRGLSVLPA